MAPILSDEVKDRIAGLASSLSNLADVESHDDHRQAAGEVKSSICLFCLRNLDYTNINYANWRTHG